MEIIPSTSHMMWETHPIGPSGRHLNTLGCVGVIWKATCSCVGSLKFCLSRFRSCLMIDDALTILVFSGCCNKIPQTGELINNRNLLLTVLEAEKSKIRCQHGHGPIRALFLALKYEPLHCTFSHEGRQGISLNSLL